MSTEQEISRLREQLALLEQLKEVKERIQKLEADKYTYPYTPPYCTHNCRCCSCNCWRAYPYYPTYPYIVWGSTSTSTTTITDQSFGKSSTTVRF